MLPTYPAMLRDGKLEWGVDGPPPLPPGTVPVHVTLLTSSASKAGGPAMAAALCRPSRRRAALRASVTPPSGSGRSELSDPCPVGKGDAR